MRSPADLYGLDVPTLAGLERMGEKSARNLVDNIEKSRNAELTRFIYGLGIPGVGEEVAKILGRHFGSLEALLDADWASLATEKETIRKENTRRKKKQETPQAVPLEGIGPELMESIEKFMREPHNRDDHRAADRDCYRFLEKKLLKSRLMRKPSSSPARWPA